jgi:MFS family permease
MASERPPLASVEAVREELRRLGYLDSGLDRFVLGSAGNASPFQACLGVALRVGAMGGLVLGSALTLAAVSLDPHLLSEPLDLTLLGLYLVVACGMLTAVAALAAGLLASRFGRRLGRLPGPNLSRNIGLAIACVGLVYSALWWRSHAASAPVVFQIAAALVALGLSLVLARVGALAAVAVLAASGVGARLPRAGLDPRRLLPLLGAAAACLAGGLAAAAYFGEQGPAAPDFAVVPTGLRVRVIGVDGLDARMATELVARGEMPGLRALLGSGAHGRLRAEAERVPAIVWTTVGTGRGPEAHGIRSLEGRRLPGMSRPMAFGPGEGRFASSIAAATDLLRITRTQPPTSLLRSVKTLWNVASEKGLRVGVVNWWATWPADPINGYVVTDRAFFKLEKGGPLDREVYPAQAFEPLRALLPAKDKDRAHAIDTFHLAAARLLRGSTPPDVEALYLPGLDITTMQQLGESEAVDLTGLDARLSTVREAYRALDAMLSAEAAALAPGEVLLLVGDPGRLARRSTPAAEGLLILSGGPVRAVDLGVVSERDVAPTALHLVGLPISAELDGRVLETALLPAFRDGHRPRRVASYGRRSAPRAAGSAFDHDMVEELRSLGYIQ